MAIILLLYLVDLGMNLAWQRHRSLTKLLLMPMLILHVLLRAPPIQWLAIFALLAGLAGDFSLLHKGSRSWFMAGLGSFFAGHVLYGVLFLKSTRWLQDAPPWLPLLALPYLAILALFFRRTGPRIGRMHAPVAIYCAALCGMSLAALSRLYRFDGLSLWLPLLGSLLFMCSDTILAMDHFGFPVRHRHFKVMLGYGLAQLLIIAGIAGIGR